MNWLAAFPFLQWPRPDVDSLRRDAWAGISVGLVVVPQALAYATLAGMPPVTGLYAALLPCIVGALWGSAPLLAVGPVAITSLLTFASLQPFAAPGGIEWVQLAIWLSIYAGVIQLLLGLLRWGTIAHFVSYPVMAGFNNAAALIIMFSQLPSLLGLPPLGAGWFERSAAVVAEAPEQVGWVAAFGLGATALLVALQRFARWLPGVLLVSVVGIFASRWSGLTDHGAQHVVGAIPGGWPAFGWPPALGWEQHRALMPAALIIALVSFTEVMASTRTLGRERWSENQELIGQGLAKIASGASGAFPVSGSLSRTALNVYAGAVSGWSSLFMAACVLLSLLFLTGFLYHLPRAVLAAIIVVAVCRLLNFGVFFRLWRASRDDAGVALLAFVATLASVPHLHWGVFTGFLVATLCYLYRRAHPRIIEVGAHPDGTLRDRNIHALPRLNPEVMSVRMDASLNYITGPVLERFIVEDVQRSPDVRTVLLCCSPVNDIDASGVETLQRLRRFLAGRGIRLWLSAVKKQVKQVLDRTGLSAQLGEDAFFATDLEAIRVLTRDSDLPGQVSG